MELTLQLDYDELELLEQMTRHNDMSEGWQSEEMEALGEKIRTAIEELE
jgi:hypothetical protein